MSVEQAKTISIADFLYRLGHAPIKTKNHDLWYISPWCDERTASFHVNSWKNGWYDHGAGIGGGIIHLGMELLKAQGRPCTKSDSLLWLENTDQAAPLIKTILAEFEIEEEPSLQLTKLGSIQHPALKKLSRFPWHPFAGCPTGYERSQSL